MYLSIKNNGPKDKALRSSTAARARIACCPNLACTRKHKHMRHRCSTYLYGTGPQKPCLFHPYVKAAGTRLGVAAAGSGVAQRLGISIESHRIASYHIVLSHPPT